MLEKVNFDVISNNAKRALMRCGIQRKLRYFTIKWKSISNIARSKRIKWQNIGFSKWYHNNFENLPLSLEMYECHWMECGRL